MRGVDRDHPVFAKDSAFASCDVPRTLLEERAWRDAEQQFKRLKLPTATEINHDLDSGFSKAKIATKLGIGLSTVYRILERGEKNRKRNFLG
ncbi:helix-turn-helix domain-containing protein [Rhodoferax sp.]|uniref:helix-turn-helix domain-containing protein n=1 Tax=Rhodoferax sp. TaxID=50421 RepID=UPI0025EFF766|nr:helix-turn-helix domain-containing protein [Rhodoferax sp.]